MKNFLSIGWADFGKGFLIAFVGTFLAGLALYLQATPPTFPTGHELVVLLESAGGVGVAYIIKNFFTNSQNQLMKKEPTTPPTPKV